MGRKKKEKESEKKRVSEIENTQANTGRKKKLLLDKDL